MYQGSYNVVPTSLYTIYDGRWVFGLVQYGTDDVMFLSSSGEPIIVPGGAIVWFREGKVFNITCHFTGARATEVTWKINGSVAKTGYDVLISKQIVNSFNTSQVTVSVFKRRSEISDSGDYACMTGHEFKTVKVKVTKGRLRISPDLGVAIAVATQPLILLCQFQGIEKLPVTWHKIGKGDVRYYGFTENKWSVVNVNATVTVKIAKRYSGLEDAGEYVCKAGPFSRTVKVQVYESLCSEYLVRRVTDDKITASSFYEDTLYSDTPSRGRLNTTRESVVVPDTPPMTRYLGGAWQPDVINKRQWIQVDFPRLTVVTDILIQGRSSTECCNQKQWVTSFRVLVSRDGSNWNVVKTIERGDKSNFNGNTDHDTIVKQPLPFPVIAKQIRINPQTWSEKIALRFEAVGCNLPSTLKMIHPVTAVYDIERRNGFRLTCRFHGPEFHKIEWMKDGDELKLDLDMTRLSTTTVLDDGTTTTESIIKNGSDYSDSGVYTCKVKSLKLQTDVELHAANMRMIPDFNQLWVTVGQVINISCEYRGRRSRDISWSCDKADVRRFHISQINKRTKDYDLVKGTMWKKAEIGDSGNISCNVLGILRTLPVRVIAAKNNITSKTLTIGETIVLSCDVTGNINDVQHKVFWTRNLVELSKIPEMKDRYKYNPQNKYLYISNSQLSDAGRYQCNIVLEAGTRNEQTIAISMEVNAAPNVVLEGMKTVKYGKSLHLYCKALGYPKPEIVWTRNGKPLSEDKQRFMYLPYESSPKGHLIVFDMTTDDVGSYECRGNENGVPVVKSQVDISIEDEMEPPSYIVITVGAVASILFIVCAVGCVIRVINTRKRRKMEENTSTIERILQNRPPLPKPYVQLPSVETSLPDEIQLLPMSPDAISLATTTTWDEYSETYEKYERPSRTFNAVMPTTKEEEFVPELPPKTYLSTEI